MGKRWLAALMAAALLLAGGCAPRGGQSAALPTAGPEAWQPVPPAEPVTRRADDAVAIHLSDGEITVDGQPLAEAAVKGVHTARDIVYYPEGKDYTFGEGTAEDAHSPGEAAGHTVVHISRPGAYRISGTLSAGQIAVDLGEAAESDPGAAVVLVLDNVDITCTVAPAIIVYRAYECCPLTETPTHEVDTSAAGVSLILAEGSVNKVRGSYVARIYKTVQLDEEGCVVDSQKLHKYDGAVYSRVTMNVYGEAEQDGTLYIEAENEGLCSEMHLTVYSGSVCIRAVNDGINVNEDGVSVVTVNGGRLDVVSLGTGGEGDGIDSNGWLVINGGAVTAQGCLFNEDVGVDADYGIYANSGTLISADSVLNANRIMKTPNYILFGFGDAGMQPGAVYCLKDGSGEAVFSFTAEAACAYLTVSAYGLEPGTYTLWQDDAQLAGGIAVSTGDGVARQEDGREFALGPGTNYFFGISPAQ